MSTHQPSEDQRDTAVVEAIEALNTLVETEAQIDSHHQSVSQAGALIKRVVVVGVCMLVGISLILELYRLIATAEGDKE